MCARAIILNILLSAIITISGFAGNSADVIVYGSTPGGFCAAIAAAREGASVILLEPTDHVGGLNTGGLSHCDSNQMVRSTLMGLFDEWHTRVVKDYTDRGLKSPYNPAIKDTAKWTFEPHVAMRVTMQMLKEAGVTVMTRRYLKSVTKEGPRISSLVTKDGTFKAKVFVDGSYEGDLMAAAGVEWTIGREGRAEFGESLAGKQYPKVKMNISGRGDDGKLLPLVTTDDAGPVEEGDRRVMTYSFRLCLTKDPANLVPIPKPAKYNPTRFEIVRRYLKAGGDPNQAGMDLYPLPGNKVDGNNSIGRQFSTGLVGGCNDWHLADEEGRRRIWEDHKQYTLEFIHFLRTDPAVPPKVRAQYSKLGFCKDEFADYDHFSPALYVRESRRMKGLYVISQKDIMESPKKDDPIAISSFPIDSHDCQRVALKDGGVINEGTIIPVRVPGSGVGHAYHVPYRSVLPKPDQCSNLLVPVALSCTHVGMASLRIEGAWMVIGQGAGVAAALAAKRDVAVQDLPYPVLRERLLAQGQVLELPDASKKQDAQNSAAGKPNVLLIAIDDLNDWVGCLGGHPQAVTPNIDRLAARGMLFTNAHSQATLCNPSRISVLWGHRPSSTGFYDNHYLVSNEPEFLKSHVSLPAYFTNNGYETLSAGKVFNSGNSDARGQSQVLGPDPGYWRTGLDMEVHKRPAQWHAIWDFGPQDYDEREFTNQIIASWAVKQLSNQPGRKPDEQATCLL